MIRLVMTCGACPEQYDAFFENRQVGYLRLRHGVFRVDCPECGGETIYETEDVDGDGVFEDYERQKHLDAATNAIRQWLDQQRPRILRT